MKVFARLAAEALVVTGGLVHPLAAQAVQGGSGPMYPLPANTSSPLEQLQPAGGGFQQLPDSQVLRDLDGDGKLDALSLYRGCSTWRGNGDGSFGPAIVYPAGDMPAVGVLGDLNGDAIPDAVFPDAGPLLEAQLPGAVQVLLGKPNGTFDPPLGTEVAGDPWMLVTGDFDGDGFVDVVGIVVGSSWPQLVFMRGLGTGVLEAPVFGAALDLVPTQLDAGDIDGDGALDLVVIDNGSTPLSCGGTFGGGKLTRWLGHGDGSFVKLEPSICSTASFGSLDLVDVTGDGRLDMLVGEGSATALFENAGGGQFASETILPGSGSRSLAIDTQGDLLDYGGALSAFDGDGVADLLTSGGAAGATIKLLPGVGAGAFAPPVATTGLGVRPLGLADVNGDGRLDLSASMSGGLAVALGLGDGTFEVPRLYTIGPDYISPGYLQWTTSDFNTDGVPDFAYCGVYSPGLFVTLSHRGTGYSQPVQYLPIAFPYNVVNGDFNGDGLPDLAVGPANPLGSITLLPGTGNGSFGPPLTLPAANGFLLAAGDVDGNGLTDLVVVQSNILKVLLSLGGFAFAPGTAVSHIVSPARVAVADLDGDGRDDLMMAFGGFGQVAAVMSKGGGTFAPPIGFPTPAAGPIQDLQILFADVDSDGVLDCLLSVRHATNESEIVVLRGSGTGSFVPAGSLPVPANLLNVEVADADRDGWPDVLAGTNVSLGSGSPAFLMLYHDIAIEPVDPPLAYGLASTPWLMAVADGNRDGWPDVYAAGEYGVSVSMHRWGPWHDLGHALASANGKPRLSGVGPFLPGSTLGLELSDAAPEALTTLVIGLQESLSPFKGGVLVPSADILVPAPPTDSQGELLFEGTCPPNLPPGLSLDLQFWIKDASAGSGLAASNGLQGVVP